MSVRASSRVSAGAAMALGAAIGDPTLAGASDCNAAEMDAYAAMVGQIPAVVMSYQRWGEAYPNFSSRCMSAVATARLIPMVTWEPWGDGSGAAYRLSNIVRGDFDAYIRHYAIDAGAWGQPFFLRFAHEMNGDWYPWGTKAWQPVW